MTPSLEPVDLEVRRVIPAVPQRVFDAWTSSEELLSWWGPPGGRCSHAKVDLRPGGNYRIVNVLPDSSTVTISGQFLEVLRPDSLTYTWISDPAAQLIEHVTVHFKAHDGGTEVVVSHKRISSAETLRDHEAGWTACLHGLATYLA